MGIKEALDLLANLAKLGASPAVQDAVQAYVAKQLGIPQVALNAAINALQDIQDPKE